VSGQNVAFVVAAAAPLLGRLGLRSRMIATVALLVLFATVTLRAVGTAGHRDGWARAFGFLPRSAPGRPCGCCCSRSPHSC
jgi:hypothetical protein